MSKKAQVRALCSGKCAEQTPHNYKDGNLFCSVCGAPYVSVAPTKNSALEEAMKTEGGWK